MVQHHVHHHTHTKGVCQVDKLTHVLQAEGSRCCVVVVGGGAGGWAHRHVMSAECCSAGYAPGVGSSCQEHHHALGTKVDMRVLHHILMLHC
jgi:hypothetical protein